jgi:hypothetical protein
MNAFDQINNNQPAAEPAMPFETFSGCPACHKSGDILQVGRQLIEFCVEHRLYWFGPLNPWSEPCPESEAREKWNSLDLDNYKQVQPWLLGQKIATI